MAFKPENFSVLAYANGFTLWHYTSAETVSAIKASRYFNSVSDIVRSGDFVMTNSSTSNTPAHHMLVLKNTGGTITSAPISTS